MSIETMKLVLATLEKLNKDGWILADFEDDVYASMDALRAAIEQAEKQEPVAYWRHESYVKSGWAEFSTEMASDEDTPLYTAPPRREWQGLTDEEISAVDWRQNETLHDFARAIEAKLKEKNT